tara:strand:+ start:4167 stop:5387 length:1221 start_codon:yes stop_codon:yes gene_type:complete
LHLNLSATRDAGLAALQSFAPEMGRQYADSRNFDRGMGEHTSVSVLSAYISRRLITEQEVVLLALSAHGYEEAEKFVQEVFWRAYFKGWLELRPQVWDLYRDGLNSDLRCLKLDRGLRSDVSCALSGKTGIACFDSWVVELQKTGYLHNHARMWFASIWIFTLRLPWRLGADFFYRHLLDGDAASNTLSWRWVAGLHTRGRPYIATARNVTTFTGQRFTPKDDEFENVTHGLELTEPDGLPPVLPLRSVNSFLTSQSAALLITDGDCHLEDFNIEISEIKTVAVLSASHLRSALDVSERVLDFENSALIDTAARIGVTPIQLRADGPDVLLNWALAAGVTQIVTSYVTRGPLWDWLEQAKPRLSEHGIIIVELQRDWDAAIWPYATAGFFKVKKQVPGILKKMLSA